MFLQECDEGRSVRLIRNNERITIVKKNRTHIVVTGENGRQRIEGLFEGVDKCRS